MSKKEDFENFLKKENKKEDSNLPINWEEKKSKWLKQMENLDAHVKEWLREYSDKDQLKVESVKKQIHEEPLGIYDVSGLKITVGGNEAFLNPIGTIMFGTPGRADLVGKFGTFKFVLADEKASKPEIMVKVHVVGEEKKENTIEINKPKVEPKWVWKISTEPPQIEYRELNQESFLDCLIQVMNGKKKAS